MYCLYCIVLTKLNVTSPFYTVANSGAVRSYDFQTLFKGNLQLSERFTWLNYQRFVEECSILAKVNETNTAFKKVVSTLSSFMLH